MSASAAKVLAALQSALESRDAAAAALAAERKSAAQTAGALNAAKGDLKHAAVKAGLWATRRDEHAARVESLTAGKAAIAERIEAVEARLAEAEADLERARTAARSGAASREAERQIDALLAPEPTAAPGPGMRVFGSGGERRPNAAA